jgi:hypothetical protein
MLSFVDLVKLPHVLQFQNCVSFATCDPVAVFFRGVCDKDAMVSAFIAAPEVKRKRRGDYILFWDNKEAGEKGSYHVVRYLGNQVYVEMQGYQGKVAWYKLKRWQTFGLRYDNQKVTRDFELPLIRKGKHVDFCYKVIEECRKENDWTAVSKMFESLQQYFKKNGLEPIEKEIEP